MVPVPQLSACGSYQHWLLAASLLVSGLHPGLVLSAPTGGEVVSGEGHIEQQGNRTDVVQQSGHMVVDWQEFNIGQQEHVHFEQPDSGAAVLNRVYQGGESQILGRITGRGQVWLLNPNGVLFGRSARVEVGSLVAAGLWMDAGDFMAGRYVLDARHGAGRVHNAGILEASSVGLAGSSVENTGQVLAYSGHVELAAGTEVAVDFAGDGLLRFAVREGSGGEVLNTGELSGKAVALSARAASQVFSGVLNTGQQAAGLSRDAQGQVRLTATSEIQAKNVTVEGETIAAAGTVDVSGDRGEGGQVQLSGMESVVLSGSINASSSVAAGGRVAVVAEQIEVLASTRVDVSGARGGGQIEIGGGYRGARVLGRTAESLTVESGAEFRADATAHGNGGQAVFWSEGTTRFGGYASARGGEHSGDGGQVEVSGREHLWWGGHADLRAPHGRTGELLLDPGTVRICSDATVGCVASAMDVFTDAALAMQLGTADVTIATSAASSGTEDINVDSAVSVDWGSTSTNTLTLNAGNNINLAGTFTAAAGTLVLNVGGTLSLGEASLAVGTVSAGQLSGSTGDQTLSGPTAGATWTVSGGGAGNLMYGGQTVGFTGMEHLTGGTGADTFMVMAAHTGNLSGGDGDDEFVLAATLTGILDGGADIDVLRGRNAAVAWELNGMDAGTYDGQAFTAIENLMGGSGADTFTLSMGGMLSGAIAGNAGRNIYNLAGGMVTGGITAGAEGDTFTVTADYMDGLAGGEGPDTFQLSAVVMGIVSGGGGNDRYELGAGGRVTNGIIDTGGDDTLVSTTTADATFRLAASNTYTSAGLVTGFSDIENLQGGDGADTLQGPDAATTWTVSGIGTGNLMYSTRTVEFSGMETLQAGVDDDRFMMAGGTMTGTVLGGAGMNTLDYSAHNTALVLSVRGRGAEVTPGVPIGVQGAATGLGGFDQITDVAGSPMPDTLNGLNMDNIWALTDDPDKNRDAYRSGGGLELFFGGIENLVGGARGDDFTVGRQHTGNLVGGGGTDVFNINAEFTGMLEGGAGADTLRGRDATVTWALSGAGAGTYDGQGFTGMENLLGRGTDTLEGRDADLSWAVTGMNAGTHDGHTFTGMENLAGGSGADAFTLGGAVTGTVSGGAGADVFTLQTPGSAGTLAGGGGADTLEGRDADLSWTVTGAGAGTHDGYTFTGMENLAGGTGADTLQGRNADLSWTVTGVNAGTHDGHAFTGMENLAGGSGADIFTLNSGGMLSGAIAGNAGGNTYNLAGGTATGGITAGADGDTFAVTAAFTGSLAGGTGGDTFRLGAVVTGMVSGGGGDDRYELGAGGQATLGITDTAGDDTLASTTTAGAIFTLGVTHTYEESAALRTAFSGIERLVGGSGADTFRVERNYVGDLSGGAGPDVFDIGSGRTLTGTVQGGSGDNQYVLRSGGSITGRIIGGDDADHWQFFSGSMAGSIMGGAGANHLDYSGSFMSVGVQLVKPGTNAGFAGTAPSVTTGSDGTGFDDITELSFDTGNPLITTARLTGADMDATWTLTSADHTCQIGGRELIFRSADRLQGGSRADTFNVNAAYMGNLSGGDGDDRIVLGMGGSVSGTLSGEGGMDTLQGRNTDSIWSVTGLDFGTYQSDRLVQSFSMIETLQGGSADDRFVLDGGRLTGQILGGTGSNHLVYSSRSGSISVVLSGSGTNVGFAGMEQCPCLTGGFDDITELSQQAGGGLTGVDAASAWTLAAVSDMSMYSQGGRTLVFRGTTQLQGGTDADAFMVEEAYVGALSGGDGADRFVLGAEVTSTVSGEAGADTFVLQASGSSARGLDGGTDIDTLQGRDVDSTWTLTGSTMGRYMVGPFSQTFSNMEVLAGGTGADTFNVDTDYTGSMVGGGGDDIYNLNAMLSTSRALDGGEGSDSYIFGVNGLVRAGIDDTGTSGEDDLGLSSTATDGATFTINAMGAGSYKLTAAPADRASPFAGIETLQGGRGADIFNLEADHTGDLSGGRGNDIFNLGAIVTGEVSGGDDDDRYELGAGGQVTGGIMDTGGDDTLVSTTMAGATFTLDTTNTYESALLSTTFSGIDNLAGGSGADIFALNSGNLGGSIAGNAGGNTYNLAGGIVTGGITAGEDGDTFNVIADHAGALTGGMGADTFNLDAEVIGMVDGGEAGDNYRLGTGGEVSGGIADTGGTGMDTLTGHDADRDWTVTAPGEGGYGTQVAFSGMENLQGGSGTDDFVITAELAGFIQGGDGDNEYTFGSGGEVGGTVTGGADRDDFVFTGGSVSGVVTGGGGTNHLDYSGLNTAVVVVLRGTGTATGFAGTATATGGIADITELSGGGSAMDRLTGQDADAAWTLTAGDDEYSSDSRTLRFRGVEHLGGGSGADDFTVSGAHSGDLVGAAGADSFTLTAVLTGDIFGTSGANTYTFGTNGQVDGTVRGGSDADHFVFAGGSVSERVVGGAGANHLDYSGLGTMVEVALTGTGMTTGFAGTGPAIMMAFDDITELSGGMATTDILVGQNVAATWILPSGDDSYSSASRTLSFRGMEDLQGGTGMDGFMVSGGPQWEPAGRGWGGQFHIDGGVDGFHCG